MNSVENKELHIVGPPGTGKSTYLAKQIELAAEKYSPELVMACSFTRAAVAELNSRKLAIPEDNLGTLHSFCYRSLDHPEICETQKGLQAFSEAHPRYALSGGTREAIDDGMASQGDGKGDKYLMEYSRLRALMVDRRLWPSGVKGFAKVWEQYKQDTGSMDFTDLIETALREVERPACYPMIGFFDECFPPGVMITMNDGTQIPIERIVEDRLGGKILSFNEKTKEIESKEIIGWYKVPLVNRQLIEYGPLLATEDHPVYTRGGFKKCIDLSTVEVLQLNHEKLRQFRESDNKGTIHYSRITSWRRFHQPKSRSEGKCQSKVLPRNRTSRIFKLEIPAASTMGIPTSISTIQDRVQWDGLSLLYEMPSSFYNYLAHDISNPEETKTHNSRIFGSNGKLRTCSVVYGRRKLWSELCGPSYIFFPYRRFGKSRRISICEKEFILQSLFNKKRLNIAFYCKRSQEFGKNYIPACATFLRIQNKFNPIKGTEEDFFTEDIRCSECPVSYLWKVFQTQQVTNSLWGAKLLFKEPSESCRKVEEKESTHRGSCDWDLCDLWEGVFQNKKELFIKQKKSNNLQQNLSSISNRENKEKEERWVYCIDVEDNHNFFANSILVHNCQDFSALEIALVRKWSKSMEQAVLVYDPAQSIYRFKGAAPEAVYDQSKVFTTLKQSYRLPAAVRTAAETLISRAGISREYADRGEEGEVYRETFTYHDANQIIDIALPYVEQYKSVLVLTACGYMLNPLLEELRRQGIPFANPFRRKRRDWNPLHKVRDKCGAGERVAAFLAAFNREPRQWMLEEVLKWLPLTKGITRKGWQEYTKALSTEKLLTTHDLLGIFTAEDLDHALSPAGLWWLDTKLNSQWSKTAAYAIRVGMREPLGLIEEPLLNVGTIHSTKGGEADVVILFPDVSPQGYREITESREGMDAAIRQFYVGMTRARETLIWGEAAGRLSFPWIEV